MAQAGAAEDGGRIIARLRVSGDPWHALRTLRIGCVQYLNSRPLICAYDGPVIFGHPSDLAKNLAAGVLDVALVPVFEVLRNPVYALVDDVAVACDGDVFSVILAHRGPLAGVRSIAADPASLTSVNLLRVLLAEFHGMKPEFGVEGDARLIIGNQAIEFRMSAEASAGWGILDLGGEWKRRTGLPFTFAVWAMRAGQPAQVADALRAIKAHGVARIDEIVRSETFATPGMREEYLTRCIRFDLREPQRRAIEEYRALLTKHGLIAPSALPLRFV